MWVRNTNNYRRIALCIWSDVRQRQVSKHLALRHVAMKTFKAMFLSVKFFLSYYCFLYCLFFIFASVIFIVVVIFKVSSFSSLSLLSSLYHHVRLLQSLLWEESAVGKSTQAVCRRQQKIIAVWRDEKQSGKKKLKLLKQKSRQTVHTICSS